MIFKKKIKQKIEEILNSSIINFSPVGGGCISDAYKIVIENNRSFFLKTNTSQTDDMFEKEAHGLHELKKADAIRIPNVISYGSDFILLEFITQGTKQADFFEDFGRRFAALHKFHSGGFGFFENNFIGSNPQINIPAEDEKHNWTRFYLNKRLLFQIKLAEKSNLSTPELRKSFSALENKIDKIITDNGELPSLLHGDLWGGNYMVDENGKACLIDPAVYFGNREADLAMTKLFGGFSSDFYAAYNEAYPLPEGYSYRENIYKLYHVLNHLNLFGRSYYSQAISLIKYYL